MATKGVDVILWSVRDTDVTTSPAIFMKWPSDTWIQTMWNTTQLKEFVQLKDVRWKSPEKLEILVEEGNDSERKFDKAEDKVVAVADYSQRSRRRE